MVPSLDSNSRPSFTSLKQPDSAVSIEQKKAAVAAGNTLSISESVPKESPSLTGGRFLVADPSKYPKLPLLTRLIYGNLFKMKMDEVVLLYQVKTELNQLKKAMRRDAKVAIKTNRKINKQITSKKLMTNHERRNSLQTYLDKKEVTVNKLKSELDKKKEKIKELAKNYPHIKACSQLLADYKKMEKKVAGFELNLMIQRSLLSVEGEIKNYGKATSHANSSFQTRLLQQAVESHQKANEGIKKDLMTLIKDRLANRENDRLVKMLDQMGLTTNPQRGLFEAVELIEDKLTTTNLEPLLKKMLPSLAPFYAGLNQTVERLQQRQLSLIKKELKEVAALEKEYMFVSISGLEDKEKAKLKAKINKWKTTQEDFAWAKKLFRGKREQ